MGTAERSILLERWRQARGRHSGGFPGTGDASWEDFRELGNTIGRISGKWEMESGFQRRGASDGRAEAEPRTAAEVGVGR